MTNSYAREPIGQLLKTIVDNRGKSVPTANDGIPLIATNCIKEERLYPTFENIRYVSEEVHRTWFRAHLKPDDILFVNKGTPGRVCMVPDPVTFCAAQDMIGLRADRSKVYPRYLFAFLRSEWVKEKIRNYHVGLVIPHFKKQDLDTITVPKRSDKEQKEIGDLYFLLSEKIELNNRINVELEGIAKLLYDHWFVQFDFPMTAAQAAALGNPQLAGKPYRSSGGKMIYNKVLKREIPEGWKGCKLEDVLTLQYGKALKKDTQVPGDYPVYGSGGIYGSHNVPLVQGPGIIVGRKGSVGELYWSNISFYPTDTSYYVEPKAGMDLNYAYFLLQRLPLKSMNSDSAVPGLSRIAAYQLPATLPDKPLIAEFGKIAAPLRAAIANNEKQNQELIQLRDWLLPMLMNGQVTVN